MELPYTPTAASTGNTTWKLAGFRSIVAPTTQPASASMMDCTVAILPAMLARPFFG